MSSFSTGHFVSAHILQSELLILLNQGHCKKSQLFLLRGRGVLDWKNSGQQQYIIISVQKLEISSNQLIKSPLGRYILISIYPLIL